jgi:putative DNA primase/helicase
MSTRIECAENDRLLVRVTANGTKGQTVELRPKGGGDPLEIDTVPLLDADKREKWVAHVTEKHGGAACAGLGGMLLAVAGRIAAGVEAGDQGANEPVEGIEPWPDPVNGAALLADIEAAMRRFVVMHRREQYAAAALWAVFAHTHDAFRFSPILIATSPEKGSGKTRLLEILSELTPRPWLTTSPSDAVVFRKIDKVVPTFLLDEGDNVVWKERKELLSIFNAGYQRRTATVSRCVGEGASLDVNDFSTWCPKALSCLKVPLPDTTVSRSIVIRFKKKTRDEPMEQLRERTAIAVFSPLCRMAAKWATDNIETLRAAEPVAPDELTDRSADAWEPLLAIADLAGGGWPDRARAAALYFGGNVSDDAESAGAMLLADLRDLFTNRHSDRLSSRDVLEELGCRDDRPWSEWSGGRPLTARGLAKLLKPFSIAPATARNGDKTFKGYLQSDLEDAWSRYLPPLSVTSVTSRADNALATGPSVTPIRRVTDTESANHMRGNDVTDVTDGKPPEREEVFL